MLGNIQSSFIGAVRKLRGRGKLTTADVEAVLNDIKSALIDSDVSLEVVNMFLDDVREKTADIEYSKSIAPVEQIVKVIGDELQLILGADVDRKLSRAKKGPTVYMLIGLQGAGKTTLAGKLGHFLKKNGHTPLLVAADLQRPGAVKQLEIVGEKAGVQVFAPNPGTGVDGELIQKQSGFSKLFGGRDASNEPINVAKQGVEEAKNKLYDTVIIDTAGRLGVDEELLKQAAAIKDAVNPDEVLFVMDSTTGQDAVNSAKAFDEAVGLTASVLTKFDADSKGGAALSVTKTTGKPILFAGTGEKFEDFEVFHPDRVASRILDQGDILTLLESAEAKIDSAVAQKATQKLISGEDFDLNDFLEQMNAVKQMGNIKNMMGMLPGMAQHKQALDNFDEGILDRIGAIIQSMTPFERANPRKIDGSRKQRISRGAGVEVSSINQMLTQFGAMQKMMKKVAGNKKGGFGKMLQQSQNDGDQEFDASDLQGAMSDLGLGNMGGIGAGNFAGGMPQMPGMPMSAMMPRGGVTKRKAQNSKKKKGKSGNPAKRAAEEKALREKMGLE